MDSIDQQEMCSGWRRELHKIQRVRLAVSDVCIRSDSNVDSCLVPFSNLHVGPKSSNAVPGHHGTQLMLVPMQDLLQVDTVAYKAQQEPQVVSLARIARKIWIVSLQADPLPTIRNISPSLRPHVRYVQHQGGVGG